MYVRESVSEEITKEVNQEELTVRIHTHKRNDVTPIEVKSHSESNPASARPGPAPGLACLVTARASVNHRPSIRTRKPRAAATASPPGPPADQPVRAVGHRRAALAIGGRGRT